MWDFIIYLKCCKYDGCRVASRCCSRLVLRCESDSDLDSQGKTVERYILCKLSPSISELSGIAWKHGGCRKILNVTFWTKVTFDSLGQKIPPDITRFRNRGRVTDRWNPGSMTVEVFDRILKNRDLRENVSLFPFLFLFPLFLFLFRLFSFSSLLRFWDHQFSGGWRKSLENKFQDKNIKQGQEKCS